jgi:APA family basic amino acid/polyamine antiporter
VTASISQKSAVAIGLGAIIGAGIFVLSGTAIALAGEFALLSFILVGVVALIVAFELGELGCLMPNAQGASYSYIRGAFGNEMGFISGILLYFSYVSSVPVIALGFSDYFASLLGFSDYEYQIMIALTLVAVLSLVNILGISKAAKAELGLVSFKIFVLAILVSFAFVLSFQQHFANISNFASLPGQKNLGAVFAASVAIFFAYAGFQSISTVSSEVRGGAKGAARAIIYAVSISLVLYVLVAISLIFLAPATSYGISGDPIAYALENSGAPVALTALIKIGALVATTSATLAMILSSSRILHQLGSDGLLPGTVGRYDLKRDVPTNGVIISAILSIPFLFLGNIFLIAAVSNFGLIFSYIMASLSVLKFRRSGAKPEFKTPYFPYLPVVAIAALLLLMVGMPGESLTIGVIVLISLIVLYQFLKKEEPRAVSEGRLFEG